MADAIIDDIERQYADDKMYSTVTELEHALQVCGCVIMM